MGVPDPLFIVKAGLVHYQRVNTVDAIDVLDDHLLHRRRGLAIGCSGTIERRIRRQGNRRRIPLRRAIGRAIVGPRNIVIVLLVRIRLRWGG